MSIYDSNGYLNIRYIKSFDAVIYVVIGGRGIGKTYGVLKQHLTDGNKFIYLRRTSAELEAVAVSKEFSPFYPIDETIELKRDSKYTYSINRGDAHIAEAMSLTSVAKIRGFSAAAYTSIIYDEFIPEKHIQKIGHEFDALMNAYETINRNRELEGKPPVRLWLLANSNNLNNPILNGLGLTNYIGKLINAGKEFSYLSDRKIVIVNSMCSPISDAKKQTAIYKALPYSDFTEMSLNNSFAYDDFSNIRLMPLKEYTARCTIGDYTILDHKNNGSVYMINKKLPAPVNYDFNPAGIMSCRCNNCDIYYSFLDGTLFIDSYETKVALADVFLYLES